jgi:hypothetical protein
LTTSPQTDDDRYRLTERRFSMRTRERISIRKHTFNRESEENLLEETLLQWRALGPAAAWQAIYDMLGWWFTARGLDPEAQRVDRTHVEIHPVPWLGPDSEATRRA